VALWYNVLAEHDHKREPSVRFHPSALLKPAILLSLLGLAMTLEAIVRLRPYVHGRYNTDPKVWQQDPVSCVVCFLGLALIGVGAWLWVSEMNLSAHDDEE
jgi:hypothetical protein